MTFSAAGPSVRTHRRGGKGTRRTKRRKIFAPWIIVVTVTTLVLGLVTAGFTYLITAGCDGEQRFTLLTSQEMGNALRTLARDWAESGPEVEGTCVAVDVVDKDSADVQQALSPDWNTKLDGAQPDVWVPEASAWARMAEDKDSAAKMLPELRPSVATSSTVIAMPKVMAAAMGVPDAKLTWAELLKKAGSADGWGAFGHADWGKVKLGMANPLRSTASLLGLLAIIDGDDNGEVTDDELDNVVTLTKNLSVYSEDSTELIAGLRKADGEQTALAYVSAFPALERDVLSYNRTNPAQPLVAVYPSNGSPDADYPYLTLNAPWSTPVKQEAARQFLEFVRGDEGRAVFQHDGFRDPNRNAGGDFNESNGLQPAVAAPPRALMLADAVTNTVRTWTALNRVTNLLFVVDTSEPMGAEVKVNGQSTTLLAVAGQALKNALGMFADKSHAGLWQFSADYGQGKDWAELVKMGELTKDRRTSLNGQIDALVAGDTSGLYATTLAAYEHMQANYVQGAKNMVVLLTAGTDTSPNRTMDLQKLTGELTAKGDPNKPVTVVTIGYGQQADENAMQAIAAATKGQYFPSTYPDQINKALLNALFTGR
ncbi:VWA domain-containing protein [Actinorhabdospora filicis]|uniref:VWA domain-containing protein n=1 Tax=Actinorhabdospora filicis TaxID=1785913 RepID=A0A9W6SLL2_9ACTN|nr:substrate-binding and VWA domain-containing protein [Actinorhabdospora filicis]GLZ79195.1 VWA domain-containing protein [Actinorhabdospora filicis]